MNDFFKKIKTWLASLSYRTGIAVLVVCAIFYVISFAQMLLPISVAAKGTLWVVFFGLAKTAQYSALLILGKAGWQSLRRKFHKSGIEEAKAPTHKKWGALGRLWARDFRKLKRELSELSDR